MADAKKCDRCGKYYDDESSKDKHFKVNDETVYQVALINASDHHICEYDLCDECCMDMFWWCNEEEVEHEEEDNLTEEDVGNPYSDKYIERGR